MPPPNFISAPLQKLLRAALGDEASAVNFYQTWRSETDFENISQAEYELLPKVYENLRQLNFADELTPKIKGICRRTWLENQLYQNEILKFFDVLVAFKLEFILLTREPLLFCLKNKSAANFFVGNFQILLRAQITPELLKIIGKNGWRIAEKKFDESTNRQALWLKHGTHLSIGVNFKSRMFDENIWKHTEVAEFGGRQIKLLSAADYLLYLLETKFLPAKEKNNGRWILFGALTLQNENQIDWERLSRRSQALQLNFPLVEMLDETIKYTESENFSQSRYKFFLSPPGKLRRTFSAFRSLKKSYRKTGKNFSVRGFLRFLQQHWKVKSNYELSRQIGKKIFKY